MSWIAAWLLLTSCHADPFVCQVQPAFTDQGQPDLENYRVNKDCLKGVSTRLRACYSEAK